MIHFYQTYECKIDDKGRLKLPSSLVKLLQSSEDKNFVIKRAVFQQLLRSLPNAALGKTDEKDKRTEPFREKRMQISSEVFTAGVKNVELDSSERDSHSKRFEAICQSS